MFSPQFYIKPLNVSKYHYLLLSDNFKVNGYKINDTNENQLIDYDVEEVGMPTYEFLFYLNSHFLSLRIGLC